MNIYLHPSSLSMKLLNDFTDDHEREAVAVGGSIRLIKQLPITENRNPQRLLEYRHKQAIRLRNSEAKFEVELS